MEWSDTIFLNVGFNDISGVTGVLNEQTSSFLIWMVHFVFFFIFFCFMT
jgi:hypothetical protein